jgi:hypothetical protein
MTTMTAPTSVKDPYFDEMFAEAARQRRLAMKFGDKASPPFARYEDMSHTQRADFLEGLSQLLVDHWAGRTLDPEYRLERRSR